MRRNIYWAAACWVSVALACGATGTRVSLVQDVPSLVDYDEIGWPELEESAHSNNNVTYGFPGLVRSHVPDPSEIPTNYPSFIEEDNKENLSEVNGNAQDWGVEQPSDETPPVEVVVEMPRDATLTAEDAAAIKLAALPYQVADSVEVEDAVIQEKPPKTAPKQRVPSHFWVLWYILLPLVVVGCIAAARHYYSMEGLMNYLDNAKNMVPFLKSPADGSGEAAEPAQPLIPAQERAEEGLVETI